MTMKGPMLVGLLTGGLVLALLPTADSTFQA